MRAEPMSRTEGIGISHSTRLTVLLMSWTHHYNWNKARLCFQSWIRCFSPSKANIRYSHSDTTFGVYCFV